MRFSLAELTEFLRIAVEALGRYRLRTALSVLGVVLGVAAVIAMMSVSEGAAREALAQVDALGLDNIVAQTSGGLNDKGTMKRSLIAADAERALALVPSATLAAPVVSRYVRVGRGDRVNSTQVLAAPASFQQILRLTPARGRLLADTDEAARVCVIGAALAQQIFGYADPIGETIRIVEDHYRVVGVLREQGGDPQAGVPATRNLRGGVEAGTTMAWHNVNRAVIAPLSSITGKTVDVGRNQPVEEIWVKVRDAERTVELGEVLRRLLLQTREASEFNIVVPRALLAQRYRTQRTFSVVVGSVAALALLVGGIGIMNIMLTSVVERTREIGVRRTAGAKRRDVTMQFLIETLLMTVGGGVAGILIGAIVSVGISAYAGWSTYVSITAVLLGFVVSFLVGLVFGLYPAMKAAALQPVDAMRYE
ncbi:MAG: ABC transporter permease [Cyanobacteria bacterium]|nr:ABC transporter permease [Cyanobacteriota bacterium]